MASSYDARISGYCAATSLTARISPPDGSICWRVRITRSALLLGATYGVSMGLIALLRGGRDGIAQFGATIVKVPLLLLLTLAVTLASLSPIELVAYASSASHPFAVQISGVCFFLATLAGQVTLTRHYRELVQRNPRHRVARVSWMVLYVFVAIQAAWVLRPFVGDPHRPPSFFRPHAWSNAYVVLMRDVLGIPGL